MPIPAEDGVPIWGRGAAPPKITNICGFLRVPGTETEWRVRRLGAFDVSREKLGPTRPRSQQSPHLRTGTSIVSKPSRRSALALAPGVSTNLLSQDLHLVFDGFLRDGE